MGVVDDDTYQWLLGSCVKINSDRGRGIKRFSSKLRNSRRNMKIDLPYISL